MSDLRMPDVNRVTLVGRLTRDPELKYLATGSAVCTLGLAVSRFYKTREGERREDTTFINVETWEKTAEYCGQYLKKGRPVFVEGRLRSREWEDKTTGQKRSTIEVRAERIQQLDWDENSGGGGGAGGGGASSRPAPREIEEPVPEDDIPF
ncbi:MAG: single-stranded DNA-binding protein [FCB group bacterium]|jgi:single-strand DNA-binding protein|nr:single-stranded DNA-binding protein [FCB group bacterium]